MQIIELIGKIPEYITFAGKYSSQFFNCKGTSSSSSHSRDVTDVLSSRCTVAYQQTPLLATRLHPAQQVDTVASFLTPMLRLHPDQCAKASDLIHHNWLDTILPQGKIDVIGRVKDEERRRRRQQMVNVFGGGHASHLKAEGYLGPE